jgi:prepilin-type N-terminal cleavage/methylation domain-containing protein
MAGRKTISAKSGFTLMELVLVMLLMAVVAAVSAPNLRGFIAGRRSADTATEILAMARWARSQAISEGRVYQLNIDPSQGKVWVETVNPDGTTSETTSDIGAPLQLPGGGKLQIDSDLPRGDNGAQIARFYPTGRTEPGTIRLTDDRGTQFVIVCKSASESYHIAAPGEVQ